MELPKVYKIDELPDGKYTVCQYEIRKSNFSKNPTYKLELHRDGTIYKVWSNSFIDTYISDKQPQEEFDITIKQGNPNKTVDIEGYTRWVKLKPKKCFVK